jgi:hypothetical protein
MTNDERYLVHSAVRNALVFGNSWFTASKDAIADNGYTWTDEHEREACAVFDRFDKEMGKPPKED